MAEVELPSREELKEIGVYNMNVKHEQVSTSILHLLITNRRLVSYAAQ